MRWTDTDPVQESQDPHQEERPQRSMSFPATEGSGHGRGEGRGRALLFESAGEIDILHQRQVGEASHLFEDRTTHEQGLVAGGDAAQSRSPIHHPADDASPRRWAIESDIEPSAYQPLIGHCPVDHRFGIAWKLRVGMEKQ